MPKNSAVVPTSDLEPRPRLGPARGQVNPLNGVEPDTVPVAAANDIEVVILGDNGGAVARFENRMIGNFEDRHRHDRDLHRIEINAGLRRVGRGKG